jgi:hypothetical protein
MNSNEGGIVLPQKDTYFPPDTYPEKKTPNRKGSTAQLG